MGNRGFTLLELVVALAVGIIIVLAMSRVYVWTTRAGIENNAHAYMQRQAALILDEMGRQIRAAKQLQVGTCSGVTNSLQVTHAADTSPFSLHWYCYRRDSAASGTSLIRDHCAPAVVGGVLTAQPNCATPDQWPLLSGAPVNLTTVNGPTVDGSGNCGTTAGFCPGSTGSAPNNSGTTATVTFRLRYRIPGSSSFQAMTFTSEIYRRN